MWHLTLLSYALSAACKFRVEKKSLITSLALSNEVDEIALSLRSRNARIATT